MVDVTFLGSNLFCVYRWSRLVFPTPSGEIGVRIGVESVIVRRTDLYCP